MFICNIRALLTNQTYLYGLTLSLNEMLFSNPGWSYLLLNAQQELTPKAHLTVLDFTGYSSLDQITPEESLLLSSEKGYDIVVLLKIKQTQLVKCLYTHYDCALLPVDGHHFPVRDVIEASMRRHRYISPFFYQIQHKACLSDNITFTKAELKVLTFLSKGESGIQIAKRLFRSQKTISSHKRNIMKKLGAKDDISLRLKLIEL